MEDITSAEKRKIQSTVGDKYWRLTHLYKIKNKEKSVVLLKPNNAQSIIHNDTKYARVIRYFTIKARQMGVSTWWMAWFLDNVIFRRNYTCGVLAHKWESLKYIMSIIEFLYTNMKYDARPEAEISKQRIYLPAQNSTIFVSLEIVSTTLNALVISEICKCDDEKVKLTIAGAIANQSCDIVCESTAEGMKGIGYALYQSAYEDITKSKNGFKRRFLPWFIHEEYFMPLDGLERKYLLGELKTKEHTIKMIEHAKKHYDITISDEQLYWYKLSEETLKETMKQEHPYSDKEAFLATGGNYFNLEKIQALYDEAIDYEKDTGYAEMGQDYIAYRKPALNHIYVLGCDPANGGANYFVFKIIDVSIREEAFVFRARCGIDYGFRMVNKWGRFYNNALAGIEEQNHGHAVLLGLEEVCRYPNIYKRRVNETRHQKANVQIKYKLGWDTTNKSKDFMLDELRFAVEGKYEEDVDHFQPLIRFYDKTLLEECFTFINKEGKLEADEGVNTDTVHGQGFDDDIMASAIAIQMLREQRGNLGIMAQDRKTLSIFLNG